MYRRISAYIIKEYYQIIHDVSAFLICIVLPLFLLFLYGYGVSLDLDHLRLGIVMEDTSPKAQSLVQSFSSSRYFDLQIVRDRSSMTDEIIRGNLRGFIVIPSYFSEFNERKGVLAPIQVIADGSEPNTANFVQNYVKGAFQNFLLQERISSHLSGLPQIQVEDRVWYNEELESRYFLLSGSLAIIMTLIGTLLTALVVAREWERGTMEAIFSTKIKVFEIVLGKLIPYFVLGMISMSLCVAISVFVFGLPFRGSLFLLFLVSSIFLFCALGLGLMISTLSKNQVVAYQTSIVAGFLPSYILSGFLFEISSMPSWIQVLTHIIPAKYLVQCLQSLFLVGNVPELLWKNVIPMFGIGVLFFMITSKKMVKRLD